MKSINDKTQFNLETYIKHRKEKYVLQNGREIVIFAPSEDFGCSFDTLLHMFVQFVPNSLFYKLLPNANPVFNLELTEDMWNDLVWEFKTGCRTSKALQNFPVLPAFGMCEKHKGIQLLSLEYVDSTLTQVIATETFDNGETVKTLYPNYEIACVEQFRMGYRVCENMQRYDQLQEAYYEVPEQSTLEYTFRGQTSSTTDCNLQTFWKHLHRDLALTQETHLMPNKKDQEAFIRKIQHRLGLMGIASHFTANMSYRQWKMIYDEFNFAQFTNNQPED